MAWLDEVRKLTKSLGREPAIIELLKLAASYKMSPEEIDAQRQSWVRGMMPTGDPRFD